MEKLTIAERILRPLIVPLKISGLYRCHTKCSRVLHTVYGTLIYLLAIVAFLSQGYCTFITGMSRSTSYRIMAMAEFIRGMSVTAWNLFIFPGRLEKFLILWSETSTFKNLSDAVSSHCKRRFLITVILLSLLDIILFGSYCYTAIITDAIFQCTSTAMAVQFPHVLLISVYSLVIGYHGIVLLLSYITCGYIVKREFDNIKSKLDSLIRDKQIIDVDDVLQCRQEHETICKLLEVADDCFLPYSLQIYVYGVVIQCLSVYSALYEPDTSNLQPFMTVTSSLFFMTFFASGIGAGSVHASVHKVMGPLLTMKTRQLKPQAFNEVILFVANLTSTDIGFTVMKLLVLSKTSILTIFGTMVSYMIVAMQFKPDEGSGRPENNTITL